MKNSKVKPTSKIKNQHLQPIQQEELGGVSLTIDNLDELISGDISALSGTIAELMEKGKIGSVVVEIELTTKRIQDMVWLVFIQQILSSPSFLDALRRFGGTKALRFVSYQTIYITLPTGTKVQVISPFFVKAKPKRGRKKRGPQNRGTHLALDMLGFVDKIAPDLAYRAIQLALLAPSFEIATTILKNSGIHMTANKLRNLCAKFGNIAMPQRVELLLKDENETCKNRRVLLTVDGGRLRQRKKKRGPYSQKQ